MGVRKTEQRKLLLKIKSDLNQKLNLSTLRQTLTKQPWHIPGWMNADKGWTCIRLIECLHWICVYRPHGQKALPATGNATFQIRQKELYTFDFIWAHSFRIGFAAVILLSPLWVSTNPRCIMRRHTIISCSNNNFIQLFMNRCITNLEFYILWKEGRNW